MTLLALIRKPLAKASERDTGSVTHDSNRVCQSGIHKGPESADLWANVLAAPLNSKTERGEGRFAERRVGRLGVALDELV